MNKNDIFDGQLNGRRFVGFVWPSVLMMLVMALYYTIDSVFVANLVGQEGLAAINIAYPMQGLMWGFAVMLAAGSSALVSIDMGAGQDRTANQKFTFACVFAACMGIFFLVFCLVFMDGIVSILGATETLTEDCEKFLSVFLWGAPAVFLGVLFEFYIRVDGHPGFTIALYIGGGIVHLGLDILLMGPLHMGLTGAAAANVGGLATTAVMGLIYFIFASTRLKFTGLMSGRGYWEFIGRSFFNGSPEMVNESSAGVMILCYNLIVVRLAGETGVAAVAAVLNIHYFFMSAHMGYQVGVLPLLSYYFGARESDKINKVMKYSKYYMIVSSIGIAGICAAMAPLIARVYADPGSELYDMTITGLRIASLSLLVIGINVFASGFFTAFGNGIISSVISLSKELVILLIGLFVLSHFFGMAGAWWALPFSDIMTLGLSFGLMAKYRKRYGYRILG